MGLLRIIRNGLILTVFWEIRELKVLLGRCDVWEDVLKGFCAESRLEDEKEKNGCWDGERMLPIKEQFDQEETEEHLEVVNETLCVDLDKKFLRELWN